jgi:hypothetical protein
MHKILAMLTFAAYAASAQSARTISTTELKDRIRGGWAGQMIGVSYGAPTEFRYRQQIIPAGKLPVWKPEMISNSINQDDLYVDMTFAKVLDDKGIQATTEDFGAMFREAKYALWHANLASRRALRRGVPAALAGTPKYNVHANDIDFQIEADFIGLMAPGLYQFSNDLSWRAGRVMNYGDGIYGGMFVSCMYAAAFFEKDVRKIVEIGHACLPAESAYAKLVRDLLAWHKKDPENWEKVWQWTEQEWNRRDPCPEGALAPFNIDAKLNGAYIVLGLLWGQGDFRKTIEISTRAGQDSDCNPASAAGILGVMHGYNAIPDVWKSGIPAIAGEKFRYTDFTFEGIVESTFQRAVAVARSTGGKLEGEVLTVNTQAPVPAKLEQWDDYGSPVERVASTDPRWKFSGSWSAGEKGTRFSSTKGSESQIEFTGSGVILVGPYIPDGGRADIYLDGEKVATVDVYPDENASKSNESVWHSFELTPGAHTLKAVVQGEPYPGSQGARVGVTSLVVFRK